MFINFKRHFLCLGTLFLYLCSEVNTEIVSISLAVTSALVAGGYFKWNNIKDNTYCRFTECCNENDIPFDVNGLKHSFSQKIFGQPLVYEIINILSAQKEAIVNNDEKINKDNSKALVISLHGWSGVGKNYATTMIAEALYKKGMKSKFVKLFIGNSDLDCNDVEKSKKYLISEINKVVQKCSTSLIIFDEVHDICPSVLDAIKPMLDHHHAVDGVNYRNSIFIFISNIGSKEIASTLLDLYSQGMKRNEVEFHHFEPIIRKIAYYTGGFEKSSTIAQHLIDYYIPFLPLELKHVEKCVLEEFKANGVSSPTNEMIADALTVVTYGPTEDQPIFANNGCKRFSRQVPYIIEKYKRIEKKNSE